jgi:hypothetical protein
MQREAHVDAFAREVDRGAAWGLRTNAAFAYL